MNDLGESQVYVRCEVAAVSGSTMKSQHCSACVASLTVSRILIGKHSSEPMRSAGVAPATLTCWCRRRPEVWLSASIVTATVFRPRRRLQCWPHPGGRLLQSGPPTQNTGWVACHRFGYGAGTGDRNSGSKLAMVETTWKHGKGARRDFRRSQRRPSTLMSTVGDCESGDRHCEVVQSRKGIRIHQT